AHRRGGGVRARGRGRALAGRDPAVDGRAVGDVGRRRRGGDPEAHRGEGRRVVIGLPVNDHAGLGQITEVITELVSTREAAIVALAEKYGTRRELIAYIRALPQRDDVGDPEDGPKAGECNPPQRLRIPASDPNCVERAAMYIAVAELIDPRKVR